MSREQQKRFAHLLRVETNPDKMPNPHFDDGTLFKGYYYTDPEVGWGFVFEQVGSNTLFSRIYTTEVVEILEEGYFRTLNTTYRLTDIQTERNNKIEKILGND
jgi:hypothetical protein